MKPEQVMDQWLKTPIEANLLKFAAGQNIFCPSCQDVMDWRRTVIATVFGKPAQEEKILRNYTLCASCYDKHRPALEAGIARAQAAAPLHHIHIEIVDGRDQRFDDQDPDAVLTSEA